MIEVKQQNQMCDVKYLGWYLCLEMHFFSGWASTERLPLQIPDRRHSTDIFMHVLGAGFVCSQNRAQAPRQEVQDLARLPLLQGHSRAPRPMGKPQGQLAKLLNLLWLRFWGLCGQNPPSAGTVPAAVGDAGELQWVTASGGAGLLPSQGAPAPRLPTPGQRDLHRAVTAGGWHEVLFPPGAAWNC